MARDRSFSRFMSRALPSFRPTAAQAVLVKVCFDGVDPVALSESERAIADKLFGGVDVIPPAARRVVLWVKGARIGGTMLAAWRLVHLAETVPLPNVAPGEQAAGVIVGPDLRLAKQGLRYAKGAADAAGFRIESETKESFVLVRSDGKRVSIEALPATHGGSAIRGRTLVGAMLTELAFFRDADYVVNADDVVRGIRPRLAPDGGQLLGESTPFAEAGWLYEQHEKNFGHPVSSLVAECPTLLMRDDEETAAFVAEQRADDEANALREFDCQFMSAGAGFFFDGHLLDERVDEALVHPAAFDPSAGRSTGVDFGFVRDSSALAIVQWRGVEAWLAFAREIQPRPGAPLRPSEVAKVFAGDMGGYASRQMITDGHYIESVREHVTPCGIDLVRAPEGQAGKLEAFLAARKLIADKQIRIPRLPRLLAQLKSVISRPAPGGGLSISIPRRKGLAHGDLASAFVLACWGVKATKQAQAAAVVAQAHRERLRGVLRVLNHDVSHAEMAGIEAEQQLIDDDRMRNARQAGRLAIAEENRLAIAKEAEEAERLRLAAPPVVDNRDLEARVRARLEREREGKSK